MEMDRRGIKSPSARKVWIEIDVQTQYPRGSFCRLPRGRCGLKCYLLISQAVSGVVAFREEGVD